MWTTNGANFLIRRIVQTKEMQFFEKFRSQLMDNLSIKSSKLCSSHRYGSVKSSDGIERESEEHTAGSHDFLAIWYLVWQYKSSGGDDGGGPVIYNAITLVFTAVSNQGDNLVTN